MGNWKFADKSNSCILLYLLSLLSCLSSVTLCLCLQGMSETFSTLHNLVDKGVKVVMDIPYELWNETSAEVSDLKKQVALYMSVSLCASECVVVHTLECERVSLHLYECIYLLQIRKHSQEQMCLLKLLIGPVRILKAKGST